MGKHVETLVLGLCLVAVGCGAASLESNVNRVAAETPPLGEADLTRVEQALVTKHGPAQTERIRRGLRQVAERWQPQDGDAAAFEAFATEHFVAEDAALDETAQHLEKSLELLDGHTLEIERELSRYQDLDLGPMQPVDSLLAAYSPSAHISEDLFKNRIAFVALINFPVTSLEQRLVEGKSWSRDRWALARLTGRFEHRLPAEVLQEITSVSSAADRYIDSYNIHMSSLVLDGDNAGFAESQKLISHWGLRDEIRALYAEEETGLAKQRLIAKVMERIIRQEIPAGMVDSGELEWDPATNLVRDSAEAEWREAEREPDVRYRHLLSVYQANTKADRFFPAMPTHIDRAFSRSREIPEERMRAMLEQVLTSETTRHVGALISERLGRPLEPFDIWYAGFRASNQSDEDQLDAITRERYPNTEAFQSDIPRILQQLGFSTERAQFLADHIRVDPARGAGHAIGARRREDSAHLRTRVAADGMDYKGFNIAIHELGHNVEQVISMSLIDHTLLEGVPNTGFTEAFAFLFQARDLELLGQPTADAELAAHMRILDRFWSTYEIAGVAILDMEIWHWMYDHPDATPAELREAMLQLAQDVWNRYYAEVFGVRDVVLPAIYSHIIAYGLYTPDYPLGFIITTQVESYMQERELATEMERMCRLGRIAPDTWMHEAVGAEVSGAPLIAAAEAALQALPAESN